MPFTNELLQFVNKPCFLETGTFKGDTISMILKGDTIPKKMISLELSDVFFENCVTLFKNNPNVEIHHSNSKTELYEVIKDIPTEITFWLDSHWSGTPDVGFDIETLCPILEELDQIKKHSIKTHTIMVDDIRLMISTKNRNVGFDVSLDDILKRLFEINPNYTINYYDDFTGKGDVLVATIEDKPVCVHKYLTICKTNAQPPGFADFLRGTICLFNLSVKYGYHLEIDRTHPLFFFMKSSIKDSASSETQELLPPLGYDEIYHRLNTLFSYKKSFMVMTNSFYTQKNRSMENWGEISEECRDFLKNELTPSDSIETKINQIFRCYYKLSNGESYKAIHIRTCDDYLHNTQFEDEHFDMYFTKINNLVQSNQHKYVLISDCSVLCNKLKEKIERLYYWDNKKTHLGDLINNSGTALSDTICDFFILSRAEEIFYINESGFSKVVSILYKKKYTRI